MWPWQDFWCCWSSWRSRAASFSGHWVSGTLQRLPIGEGTITVIYGLTHLGFLVLYWAMEVFVTAALYWFYGKSLGFPLVVAAYTTPFFHSLLPLSDWLRLLLSVLWLLALASCTASFGFFQRRGSFQISPIDIRIELFSIRGRGGGGALLGGVSLLHRLAVLLGARGGEGAWQSGRLI